MDCPVCRQAMKPVKIGDVQIDECRQCKGIWFDKGELAEAKDKTAPDLRFLGTEIWSRKAVFNIRDEPLRCPRCRNTPLRGINFQEPDINITFCAACEGVWLNAGDFTNILDALGREAASRSVSEYVTASLKEGLEMVTNPKEFISEWRDLISVLRMLCYRVFVEHPKIRSILVGIQKSLPL